MADTNYYITHTGAELDEAIRKVLSGELNVPLQEKTVTPTTSSQIILPDSSYKGLSKVTVNPISQSYTDGIYNDGYTAGKTAGYTSGYDAGYDVGYRTDRPYKKRLKYIQSDGRQCFNTEIIPTINTRVMLDIEILSYPGSDYVAVFGERNTTQTSNLYSLWISSASTFRTDFGASSGNTSMSVAAVGRHLIYKNKSVTTIDDVTATNPSSTISTTYPLYLLSNNYNNEADARRVVARLYGCGMYDGLTITRNYIPVLDWDDVACLYDEVEGKCVYNIGTGAFTYA